MSLPRIPALEGARGLAALAVLVWHTLAITAPDWLHLRESALLLRFGLSDLGKNGVSLFFVLSGFLLGLPFLAALLGLGPPVRLRRYARARILRIFPAWLLAVAIVVPLSAAWLLDDPLRLALFATLHQFAYDPGATRHVIPQAWTLAVEVAFYTALPVLALGAGAAIRIVAPERRPAVLAAGLLAVVAGCLAFKLLAFTPSRAPLVDLRPLNYLLLSFADHFALGMLAALAFLLLRAHDRRLPWTLPLAGAAAVYVASVLGVRAASDPVSRSFIALACGLVVLALAVATADAAPARLLASAPLATLGRLSYGVYLWHAPLQEAARGHGLLQPHAHWQTLPAIVLTLAASLVLAQLSWLAVEAPALRLARRGDSRPPLRRLAGSAQRA